jgi:hypothetical protein
MLRCVRKEGKVFFAFGSKNASFVHSKAIQYMDKKVKDILQSMHKFTELVSDS